MVLGMANEMATFFDNMAPTWDTREEKNEAWFSDFIAKYCDLRIGERVLDLGCGTGVITRVIYNLTKQKVIALDLSKKMLELARKKYDERIATFIQGDFYKVRLTKFDTIICHNAYPHFLNPVLFSKKCADILITKGRLIIIHSISRLQIGKSHNGLSNLSRIIASPLEEAKNFKEFKVLQAYEDDNMYLLLLEKL